MDNIRFGNILIGKNFPVVIIAEIACEHSGDMDAAKKLALAAKEAGADIVKFQLHILEFEMVSNVIKFGDIFLDDILKKVNLGEKKYHEELMAYCKSIGVQYLCTPFCKEAADILEEIGVEAFKIGSGELTNLPMIRHIAKKGKPMLVSTGMCTPEEIREAVNIMREENVEFLLLNCTSEYPAVYEHLNLGFINTLEKEFNVLVGHSDHTTEIYSSIAALALGARVIEKHFTLPELKGPDRAVSLDFNNFKSLVDAIRKVEKSLFSAKIISDEEQKIRNWAHHSVILKRNIKAGENLKLEDLRAARPGSGIPAKFLDKLHSKDLIGRTAKHDLFADTILKWDDLN